VILFDTNVVLDLLLDRKPYSAVAAQIFTMVETGALSGCVCATTITTVHYLAAKAVGATQAVKHIDKLLTLFEVAPVNRPVIESALFSKLKDFEAAILHEAALHVSAHAIVTRDVHGFKNAKIPVYTPEEFLHSLRIQEEQNNK